MMAEMRKTVIVAISVLALFSVSAVAIVQFNMPKEYNYFKELYNPPTNSIKFFNRDQINLYISLNENRHDEIVGFYSRFTKSRAIAESIIKNAIHYKMPVNLAFALSYVESRFNPRAVNINTDGSVDRGLFQLNNSYRQNWKTKDFFNVELNVREGIRYWITECNIKERTIPITFIAYNMGPYSESAITSTIPRRRAEYIGDILSYEDMLNVEFNLFMETME